jgi:hypothetical protein
LAEGTFKISVSEPTDQQSPLVRFSGVLKEWKQDIREATETNSRTSVGVKFDFTDVTVIESTEPYNFPIASLRIPYSDRAGTAWAEFTKSLRALVPMEVLMGSAEPLDVLNGKVQEWYYAPVKLRRPGKEGDPDEKEWKLRDAKAWTLVSCEGYGVAGGAGNIMDAIVEFIGKDGKKDAEIYQWLYTDQTLKGMGGFSSAIEAAAERTLLSGLVTGGKLKEEGGAYKAV